MERMTCLTVAVSRKAKSPDQESHACLDPYLSIVGILASANAAKAGLILANRDVSASVDPDTPTEEADQTTEYHLGLTRENAAMFNGG